MGGRTSLKIAIHCHITQLRRTVRVDTQQIRTETMHRLEELFDLASAFAKGEIKHQTKDGKPERIAVKERQMWVRESGRVLSSRLLT